MTKMGSPPARAPPLGSGVRPKLRLARYLSRLDGTGKAKHAGVELGNHRAAAVQPRTLSQQGSSWPPLWRPPMNTSLELADLVSATRKRLCHTVAARAAARSMPSFMGGRHKGGHDVVRESCGLLRSPACAPRVDASIEAGQYPD